MCPACQLYKHWELIFWFHNPIRCTLCCTGKGVGVEGNSLWFRFLCVLRSNNLTRYISSIQEHGRGNPTKLMFVNFKIDLCWCKFLWQVEWPKYLYENLSKVPSVKIYGPPPLGAKGDLQASLCTFNVEGIDATDLLTSHDQQVRSICFVDCVIQVFFKAIITHFWENLSF
jgi:hypothetical protein